MIFRKKKSIKKQLENEVSFKKRVIEFWQWFSANSKMMYDAIEDGKCSDLQPMMSEQVGKLGGFGWVFGPGSEEKGGHSFTLTPEGNGYKTHLTDYWLESAPDLDHWTFYSSKQASDDIKGFTIKIRDENMGADEFWVVTSIDSEAEQIDIKIWHHLFEGLDESARFQITFLWLDEVLGEQAVVTQIGQIEFSNQGLEKAFPVYELKEVVDTIWKEQRWEFINPNDCYHGLRINEGALPESAYRSDCFYISTCLNNLQDDYLKANGLLKHPTPSIGVDYLFIQFPVNNFIREELVDQRTTIEDTITEGLDRLKAGKFTGSAAGSEYTYLDITSYSLNETLEVIRTVLKSSPYSKNAQIRFFDVDRIKSEVTLDI